MFRPGKWFQKNSGDNVTGAVFRLRPHAGGGRFNSDLLRALRQDAKQSLVSVRLEPVDEMQLRGAWRNFAFLQAHRNQENGIVKLLFREVERETQLLLNVSFLAKLKHKARYGRTSLS